MIDRAIANSIFHFFPPPRPPKPLFSSARSGAFHGVFMASRTAFPGVGFRRVPARPGILIRRPNRILRRGRDPARAKPPKPRADPRGVARFSPRAPSQSPGWRLEGCTILPHASAHSTLAHPSPGKWLPFPPPSRVESSLFPPARVFISSSSRPGRAERGQTTHLRTLFH